MQANVLETQLQQETAKRISLATILENLEQEYRDKASAIITDTRKIEENIISARASKPEVSGLLLPIYNAHQVVESARKEVDTIKDEIKSWKQALVSIKHSLLDLHEKQQKTNKQASS